MKSSRTEDPDMNPHSYLCPPDFWQGHQKHMIEKIQPLQQMLLGKLGIYMQKTGTRSICHLAQALIQRGLRTLI
jgi:hypothetical protein